MEVFWEETEDVFCPGQAAVHHVPGEVVQSRHQLSGDKRRAALRSITYSTRRALLARRHSLCWRPSAPEPWASKYGPKASAGRG